VLRKVRNNGCSISLTLVGHFLRVYTVPYNTSSQLTLIANRNVFNHVTFGFHDPPHQYSCQTALIIPAKGFIFGAFSMKCCKTASFTFAMSVYLALHDSRTVNEFS